MIKQNFDWNNIIANKTALVTRGGKKVYIVANLGSIEELSYGALEDYSIVGVIVNTDNVDIWTRDGRWTAERETDKDIVGIWRDRGEIERVKTECLPKLCGLQPNEIVTVLRELKDELLDSN